jgi:hypothetical protein
MYGRRDEVDWNLRSVFAGAEGTGDQWHRKWRLRHCIYRWAGAIGLWRRRGTTGGVIKSLMAACRLLGRSEAEASLSFGPFLDFVVVNSSGEVRDRSRYTS